MKKKIKVVAIISLLCIMLCGCNTEAQRVSYNVSQQAGNFNVTRQITVFNTRTDKILFQMTGLMDIENNSSKELVVLCEHAEGVYKKHFIYLNDNISYVVEDVTGAHVDKYFYELNFNPAMMFDLPKPVYEN